MKNLRFDTKKSFGVGKEEKPLFWHSLLRQGILANYLRKDIETYGIIKVTDEGKRFLESSDEFSISINHDYSSEAADDAVTSTTSQGGALDETLFKMLKEVRLAEAKRHGVKPWIIFLDPSLQDMASYYPVTVEDMLNISGVSLGKAQRYGAPFLETIKEYVEVNNIERPADFVIKQIANKSKSKVAIIQSIDRKIPLEDIASSNRMSLDALMDELDIIVSSGTKLDINYYLEDNLDEDVVDDIYDYFGDADSDSIDDAYKELKEDDITLDEIKLVRIKFMSDVVN